MLWERGYRRHRKMQKTVYRVRTQPNINGRIALDMQREERTQQREQTTKTLHTARPRKAAVLSVMMLQTQKNAHFQDHGAEYGADSNLRDILRLWPSLPKSVKARVIELVTRNT